MNEDKKSGAGKKLTPRPNLTLAESVTNLRHFLGKRLESIWLIVYAFENQVADWERAEPEFVFQEGVFRCRVINGDWLEVRDTPWEDHYRDVTKEFLDFIFECGMPWRVDMSVEDQYREYVGKVLDRIYLIENQFGDVAGAEFWFEGEVATLVVGGDEEIFIPGKCRDRLGHMKYRIGDEILPL